MRVPSSSLMPQRETIFWASSVACSKSFAAPVVICPMNNSSAMRPPMSTAMRASRYSRSWL